MWVQSGRAAFPEALVSTPPRQPPPPARPRRGHLLSPPSAGLPARYDDRDDDARDAGAGAGPGLPVEEEGAPGGDTDAAHMQDWDPRLVLVSPLCILSPITSTVQALYYGGGKF